jgi:quinol monooxygenase YgiN
VFTATVRFVLPQEARAEGIRALRAFVAPLYVRPDCAGCSLLQDLQEEGAFLLVERWRSVEGLQRHLRSDPFRKLLAVMDMAERAPEFRLERVEWVEGIDLLALIRGGEGLRVESANTDDK